MHIGARHRFCRVHSTLPSVGELLGVAAVSSIWTIAVGAADLLPDPRWVDKHEEW